jgi:hypothetical protein
MMTRQQFLSGRLALCLVWATALLVGCAAWSDAPPDAVPGATVGYANPFVVPTADRDLLWDVIVDVVDDDLDILREERPRLIGDTLTEGRLETRPQIGATLLEPWRRDSANTGERLESTLQTIRRRAFVHMMPAAGGYQVQVTVMKELENVGRPEFATTATAIFSNDNSLRRFSDPADPQARTRGWIPVGNDPALEQRMVGKILAQMGL